MYPSDLKNEYTETILLCFIGTNSTCVPPFCSPAVGFMSTNQGIVDVLSGAFLLISEYLIVRFPSCAVSHNARL